MALATAKQLWRLNREGRLRLEPLPASWPTPSEGITSEEADTAIREGLAAGGNGRPVRGGFGVSDGVDVSAAISPYSQA